MALRLSPILKQIAAVAVWLLACRATTGLCAGELEAEFARPPAQWKSRPLWFWNGPLDKARTAEIMERSAASGYYGFGILPTEKMGVPFLSREFLDHYQAAVDKAAALGLKMCLYDEFWFPSGGAGGLLAQQYPEALGKRLDLIAADVTGPDTCTLDVPPGVLMAAVAMHAQTKERRDLAAHVRDGRLSWPAPDGPWKVMLFVCVRDGARGLVDYLDPESVQKFVSLTYEKYYQAFPDHFGKTIDSAFYDEPTFHWIEGGRAWTPSFNRRFEEKHGGSPALLYPALWFDIGADTAAARNALFGLRAELFAGGFIKTIADWCRSRGIELTGHVDQEEVVNPVGLCGDLIKAFEHQPMPGLDQIFQYGRGSKMYKIVSSAAVNYGRRRVMTECYGAIKDMPVANLYREAMDQFAKGVNVMVPHAVWYDPGTMMFPPELSYRTEPYASALPAYNDYIGRLQRMLQQGRPVADVAVLYPIHDLQAAYYFGPGKPYTGGVIPEWADYMEVGERLALDLGHDFTFVHPEILDVRCRVAGDTIRLEHPEIFQDYRVLILPGSATISAANLAKVRQFFDRGGKVVATTRLPDRSAEFGKDAKVRALVRHIFGETTAETPARHTVHRNPSGGVGYFVATPGADALGEVLGDALKAADVGWESRPAVAGGHLTYLHKVIDGRDVYFFANSSDTRVATSVRLRGRVRLERWDPHTGRIEPQPSQTEGETTRVPLALGPVSSVFFVGDSLP